MDGRRRLAEPVTDGASARPATGTVPASRRARLGSNSGRTKFARTARRWFGAILALQLPRGVGAGAARVQADLALGRPAAHQDRDVLAHAAAPRCCGKAKPS